jgi:uncharacterized protein YkwD
MARPSLALAGAITATLLLATAAGATTSAPSTACTAAARHGTRSFHEISCPGKGGSTPSTGHTPKSHQLVFKAHHGICRDAGLEPDRRDIRQIRAATLCLVNRERARHGEPALRWNERLVASAQAHTESMAYGDYFAHVGPGGETPLTRMRRTGYISRSASAGYEVGENIAWGSLWLGTPRAIVAAWMASPGHRANILDRRFKDTGIGVSPHVGALAGRQRGGIYTQDFGVRIG